jgi:hypothetical protein
MIVASSSIIGSGRITGAFASPDGCFLAIASAFPWLMNPPARAAYGGQALRHRLALHRRGEPVPFATLDSLRFPINHVAFHPHEPVIVVGAGSYDGGWLFEGDLVLWNWMRGQTSRPFKKIPEVVHCSFSAAGDRIDALVRPWDEEWGMVADAPQDEAFRSVYPVAVPYGMREAPADIDLDPDARLNQSAQQRAACIEDDAEKTLQRRLEAWFGAPLLDRGAVWDVAWLAPNRIAAVDDNSLLDVHDLDTEATQHFTGDGHGVVILRSTPPIVHCVSPRRAWPDDGPPRARLLAFADETLVEIGVFEGSYSFTSSHDGRILGRLDRNSGVKPPHADILLTLDSGKVSRVDFGHYDCFNHFIGIDGAPALFLLQGTPASSHERKHLCRVRTKGGVERLWPILRHDSHPASHALECCGCYLADGDGEGVVIAGCHYDPDTSAPRRGFIYRTPIRRHREAWRLQTAAACSAIRHLPHHGLVAAAFLDGTLMLIDAASGRRHAAGPVTVNGINSVVFSMDGLDGRLVFGTFDGVIAVATIDELLARNASAGRMEIG